MHALCAEAGRSIEDGQRLLELVQQLSPRGVGARDLAECLALQIDDGLPYADVIRDMLPHPGWTTSPKTARRSSCASTI